MSASGIDNFEVGDAKFAGMNKSQEVFIKQRPLLARRKKLIIIFIIVLILLAVGIALLVYFLNKDSSKWMLPEFKGIVYIIP